MYGLYCGGTFQNKLHVTSTCAECMWQHKGADGFIIKARFLFQWNLAILYCFQLLLIQLRWGYLKI